MSRCTKNNVVLIVGEKEMTSDGGIMLPGSKLNVDEMEVYAVGPDVNDVKVGDTVVPPDPRLFTSKRGVAYDMELEDGRKCIIVEEDDIRYVISELNPVIKREMPVVMPRKGPIQKKFEDMCCGGRRLKAVFLGVNAVKFTYAGVNIGNYDKTELRAVDMTDCSGAIVNFDALCTWLDEDETC